MKYKAVCFDIDGTLYEPEKIRTMLRPLVATRPLLCRKYNAMRHTYRERQKDFACTDLPYMSAEPLRRHEALIMAEDRHTPGTPGFEKAARRWERTLNRRYYRVLFRRYRVLAPGDGVRELLADLKAAGVGIGLMSDWPIADKARILGVEEYCDKVLSTEDCGFLKPDSRSMQYLCAQMGVEPGEMLYVGDSYVKDVEGAWSCGIDGVLVNNRVEGDYPHALEVFGAWSEFADWLRGIMEG